MAGKVGADQESPEERPERVGEEKGVRSSDHSWDRDDLLRLGKSVILGQGTFHFIADALDRGDHLIGVPGVVHDFHPLGELRAGRGAA
jgi:hypothetical protein